MKKKGCTDLNQPPECHTQEGFYKKYLKRLFDLVLSFCAIIILSPFFLIVAVLVRVNLGERVIFKQNRLGLNEKIFTLYKFRTMRDGRDKDGKLLPDRLRLTGFGRFLRSTSLDELPQLLNILRGDMSLVGPRPLLVEYAPLYNDYQKHRHEVKPGLTGLAQVNGRNGISWKQRFDLDVKYVKSICFTADLKIVLLTIRMTFKRDGISSGTNVTMEPFAGN